MSNINDEENSTFGPFNDLEQQQYKKFYTSLDVPLMDIRKKYYSIFLIVGTILLIFIVILAITIKIPNYLKIPISIESIEKDDVNLFNHSVNVENFYAKVGDTLSINDSICKVSAPEIQEIISEIKLAQSQLKSLKKFDSLDVGLRISNLDNEVATKQYLLNSLELESKAINDWYISKKAALSEEVIYHENLEQVNRGLFEKDVISKFAYLEIKKNTINKKEELISLPNEFGQKIQQINFKIKEVNGEVVVLRNSQREFSSSYKTNSSKLNEQITVSLDKLKLYYGNFKIVDDGLILLASHKGLLTFGYQSNNLLQPGEILYRLDSSNGGFEARGFIKANKIAYLKPSLTSKIILETFPNYEWGALTGIVNNISKSPNERSLYPFSIKITKENTLISPLLQNGQTGTGYILIEKRTLGNYLFRSLSKTKDELLN